MLVRHERQIEAAQIETRPPATVRNIKPRAGREAHVERIGAGLKKAQIGPALFIAVKVADIVLPSLVAKGIRRNPLPGTRPKET